MGYLFSALTGKIAHFNSINQPIDNGIGAKIRALEESPEKILAIYTFGMTQEIVSSIFNPNDGVFHNRVSTLTPEMMSGIYRTLMDASASAILASQAFKDEVKDKLIEVMSKLSNTTREEREAGINEYDSERGVIMKAYENVVKLLAIKEDGLQCVKFGKEFMRILDEIQSRLLATIFNKPNN